MSEFPDALLELFQRAILNDKRVFFAGGGNEGADEDGWDRYHVEITDVPSDNEVLLHVMHLTIARRIAHLATKTDIHDYATKVASEWTKLADEVDGLTYDQWRKNVMAQAVKNVKKDLARKSRSGARAPKKRATRKQ